MQCARLPAAPLREKPSFDLIPVSRVSQAREPLPPPQLTTTTTTTTPTPTTTTKPRVQFRLSRIPDNCVAPYRDRRTFTRLHGGFAAYHSIRGARGVGEGGWDVDEKEEESRARALPHPAYQHRPSPRCSNAVGQYILQEAKACPRKIEELLCFMALPLRCIANGRLNCFIIVNAEGARSLARHLVFRGYRSYAYIETRIFTRARILFA
jgi:hypothetical protein